MFFRRPCLHLKPVTYQVAINFFDDGSVRSAFSQWLVNKHVGDMLKCPGFISAKIFCDDLISNSETPPLVVQYHVESVEAYRAYDSSDRAAELRAEAAQLFGESNEKPLFKIDRRLLTPLDL